MYSTRICDAILSSPVPSPEFFTVHGSRLRFSVLPRATSLKMKLQCRSVGSLNEASERSPGFFLNLTMGFTGSTMGIQWDIMGYTSIIYVCDTVDGCQILHQLKDVVKKNMGFNMFQPSKGGAGFRKNPQFISQNSGLVASLLNSGFYMWFSLHLTSVFLGLGLLPFYSQCKRWTKITMFRLGKSMASRTWTQWQTFRVHFPGYTADLPRNTTTGWNPIVFISKYWKDWKITCFLKKNAKIMAILFKPFSGSFSWHWHLKLKNMKNTQHCNNNISMIGPW